MGAATVVSGRAVEAGVWLQIEAIKESVTLKGEGCQIIGPLVKDQIALTMSLEYDQLRDFYRFGALCDGGGRTFRDKYVLEF